ncbi:Arm DNA-binding domain-containing protein [Phocaeicola plebeius]|uniref:Arm DNA-binding domain-containing protein n=1 Tax=Phocaeicola plebeius TaxID=310297 RepID=UPI002011FCF2|nr:Arm DNA-binding domain-containing protein [Phocaeicola plebeius]
MQTFIQELQGNFFLRSPKQTTPTLLYYVVRINNKKVRLATGVKVYPQHWDKGKQKAIISPLYPKLTRINNSLVNDKIEEYLKRFSKFKEYLCDNPSEITNGGDLLKSFHCCPEKFYHSVSCLGPLPSGTLAVRSV